MGYTDILLIRIRWNWTIPVAPRLAPAVKLPELHRCEGPGGRPALGVRALHPVAAGDDGNQEFQDLMTWMMGTHDLGHIHMMDIWWIYDGFLGWFSTGKQMFRLAQKHYSMFGWILVCFTYFFVGSMIFIKASTSHRPRRALPEVQTSSWGLAPWSSLDILGSIFEIWSDGHPSLINQQQRSMPHYVQ